MDTGAFDPEFPPADAQAIQAWLGEGFYRDWACEAESTVKREGAPAIHVHTSSSRVCSNALLARSSASEGEELPRGVASVKEVHDASGRLVVHAVSAKIEDESRGGRGWYWYEGPKHAGVGLAACTGCHAAAGSDVDHPGAGDYVYFRVSDGG